MNGPLVSIIIPTFNEGEWLQKTVEAITLNTPYPYYEIIVVDDGSTDNSCDFLKNSSFSSRAKIKYLRVKNYGSPRARNYGVRHAEGDILVFFDAHVLPQPNWLEETLKLLAEKEADIATGKVTAIGNERCHSCVNTIKGWTLEFSWGTVYPVEPIETPAVPGHFMAVKKSVFEEMGGFDEGLRVFGREDGEISIRAWLCGYRIWTNPKAEVHHLFKTNFRYDRKWFVYNILRFAYLHLNKRRIKKVIEACRPYQFFPEAFSEIKRDEELKKKAGVLRQIRLYDDDWYFQKFAPFLKDLN